MSEAKFTPAPWDAPKPTEIAKAAWDKLHFDGPMQFVTVGFDGWAGETIAIVYGDDDAQEVANAHLIAAAPELYTELEYAVKLLGGLPGFSGTAQIARMGAALAKARGEA